MDYQGSLDGIVYLETLPEAQRTQGIESITQIITHSKYNFGDEMIYMYD